MELNSFQGATLELRQSDGELEVRASKVKSVKKMAKKIAKKMKKEMPE